MNRNIILAGDVLEKLKEIPDDSIDCIVTSPPYYGLRDYGVDGQIGLEPTLTEYLHKLLLVTGHLKRVLKPTGTLFWNHGDSYGTGSGSGVRGGKQATNRGTQTNVNWQEKGKAPIVGYEKSLLLQNFRLAQRMVDEQKFILRNVICWHKPNAMPSSAKDRFGVDYEPVFFFTKSRKYYFEQQFEPYTTPLNRWGGDKLKADGESAWDKGTGQSTYRNRNMRPNQLGRNKRSVWDIPTVPLQGIHYATFPEALITPMIQAGCPEGGIVLDPFLGSGTTAVVANKLRRDWIGIELNPSYVEIAQKRIYEVG